MKGSEDVQYVAQETNASMPFCPDCGSSSNPGGLSRRGGHFKGAGGGASQQSNGSDRRIRR
ncbi:MAG: hypothetical protein EXR62_04840 [Chloroflexi bacterium]|nr:hypothetical protein [Chloroflexota bacterium]